MKNTFILILILILVGCKKPEPCSDVNYYINNTTNRHVDVIFFHNYGRSQTTLSIEANQRKKIDISNEKCYICHRGVTMCSDSVKVTFADGKSKIDVNCFIYNSTSSAGFLNCYKDTVSLFQNRTIIENSTTNVFVVNEDDYLEAR
ncbi:MAG: hypothetical protein EAZ85_05895 [Bacteroidetes bacterium]|nr:MAG: hypothetical protein EAZ85_05895 [Bacteroidota bacterium]TAG90121.1 MAG: hypothetical protein EAZ20_05010 [Bacteroidota bacterium]